VAVEKQNRENTFFAEGRSAVAGILTPVFSDRHQDQRKKKSKKEKKRTKRKEKIYYLYIFVFKR
jgi:hypothetical protein